MYIKWCRLLNGGRTDVHNETRFGRPSVIAENSKDRTDAHGRENLRFIIHSLFLHLSSTRLSQFNTATEGLMPDEHKQKKQKEQLPMG
jgi:hypothetical protein